MSNIIPFSFESNEIRVSQDNKEIWFNANDVCNALGFSNSRKTVDDHVDTEDVTKRDTLTDGGVQLMTYINESGLYSLIMGSRKESAKKFKRWVTSEVLPSIRKTGSYEAPKAKQKRQPAINSVASAFIKLSEWMIRSVPGIKPEMVIAQTLFQIKENTGQDVTHLMRSLPSVEVEELATLKPSAIGKRIGISARDVNLELASLRLQIKDSKDNWILTEAGMAYGEMKPYHNKGHSGYEILWKESIIDLLIKQRDSLKH